MNFVNIQTENTTFNQMINVIFIKLRQKINLILKDNSIENKKKIDSILILIDGVIIFVNELKNTYKIPKYVEEIDINFLKVFLNLTHTFEGKDNSKIVGKMLKYLDDNRDIIDNNVMFRTIIKGTLKMFEKDEDLKKYSNYYDKFFN